MIKDDLRIWHKFLSNFNGHSVWQEEFVISNALERFTDSAGS